MCFAIFPTYYERVSGLEQLRVGSATWGLPLRRAGLLICLEPFPDAQIKTTHKVSLLPICHLSVILGGDPQPYGGAGVSLLSSGGSARQPAGVYCGGSSASAPAPAFFGCLYTPWRARRSRAESAAGWKSDGSPTPLHGQANAHPACMAPRGSPVCRLA